MRETLHAFLIRQGFMYVADEPSEEDYETYYHVCEMLNRTDLDFKPVLGGVYYKQISNFSTLFVEKKLVGSFKQVKYDFYKERKIIGLGSDVIKVYNSDLTYIEMLRRIKSFFDHFRKGGNDEKVV